MNAPADAVLRAVAKYFQVSVTTLRGRSFARHLVLARRVAMFVLRTETHMTLVEIGKEFGRDHTTVLAACRKQASVAEVPEYKQAMESIRSMIQSTSRQIPFYADTNPCSGCGAVRRELLELRIEFEQFRAGFRFGDGERN